MTVCIAAVCENIVAGDAKIVLCTDGRGSGPLGNKEFTMKDRYLNHRWRYLTAGGDNDLNALEVILKARFANCGPQDETTIQDLLRAALQDLKLARCNEFTQGRYGLSYAAFLRDGKTILPEDQFRSDIFTVANMTLNVDCLVAGFLDDGFPMLLQLDGKGGVNIKEDFAVAGEGAYLAESGLTHRQHIDTIPLPRTLYCVYEAKRYAERISSVNDVTHMSVLSMGGIELVDKPGKDYLAKLYQKCAPQPIPDEINVEDLHLRSHPFGGP